MCLCGACVCVCLCVCSVHCVCALARASSLSSRSCRELNVVIFYHQHSVFQGDILSEAASHRPPLSLSIKTRGLCVRLCFCTSVCSSLWVTMRFLSAMETAAVTLLFPFKSWLVRLLLVLRVFPFLHLWGGKDLLSFHILHGEQNHTWEPPTASK